MSRSSDLPGGPKQRQSGAERLPRRWTRFVPAQVELRFPMLEAAIGLAALIVRKPLPPCCGRGTASCLAVSRSSCRGYLLGSEKHQRRRDGASIPASGFGHVQQTRQQRLQDAAAFRFITKELVRRMYGRRNESDAGHLVHGCLHALCARHPLPISEAGASPAR